MSLKKRLKKKANKYYDKGKDYVGKAIDVVNKVDPVVGSLVTSPSERKDMKEIERATAAVSAPKAKTMQDIARSRAAGYGTFNYTEQAEV